jgi:hypothetical protein
MPVLTLSQNAITKSTKTKPCPSSRQRKRKFFWYFSRRIGKISDKLPICGSHKEDKYDAEKKEQEISDTQQS